MTNAKWCDLGQHAFPEGQYGSTTLKVSEQVRNQWGGTQPCDTIKDVCAACAKDYGYRGLTPDKQTDEELDKQAESVRERSGGLFKKKKVLNGNDTPAPDVTVAEAENDRLRLSQLEREVNELRYGK